MKKLFTFLLLGLFMISMASALEFDNVKDYDPITREVIITNAYGLGDEIGKARLNTPLNVKVGVGYQKVAEFDLWAYQDYSDALKQFSFEDMKNGEKKINRDYDLKYLTYEDVEVEDYEVECFENYLSTNETAMQVCENYVVGSHYENKAVWEKITPANLKKNEKLTIGVFTDVKVGDYVDWIPTIYGVKVEEWATWTEDLNTDLLAFWKFNTSNATQPDSVSSYDCTMTGATFTASGLISGAYDYDGNNQYGVAPASLGNALGNGLTTFSFSLWFKADVTNGNDGVISWSGIGAGDNALRLISDEIIMSAGGTVVSQTAFSDTASWHHFVASYNGTIYKTYIDDISKANFSITDGLNFEGVAPAIGGYVSSSYTFDGDIDEVGVWNRALSSEEVTQLYNGGSGITHITSFDPPVITLNSPSSTNYTEHQSLEINFTASDGINLSSVKLYVNDILNQTNATGLNNTDYIFDLNLGDGNYTIYGKATDNESQETNSSSIQININTIPFVEFVTPPTLENNSNISQEYIPMEVNISTNLFKNITYTITNINTTSFEQFYTNQTLSINFTDLPDAHYHYSVEVCTTTDKCNTTELRHLNHDATLPIINITAPTGVLNFILAGDNETLNWSVSDDNLEDCWYNYNEINYSVNCSLNTTGFVYVGGINNLTFFANDTFGSIGSELASWDYTLTELASGFSSPVVEGSTTTITANVTLQDGLRVSSVVLNYNGTEFPGSNVEYANNTYFLSISKVVPGIENNVNVTFFWNVTLEDGSAQETNSNNQTIVNVSIDNCSVFTNTIFNFTMVDEATQVLLNGAAENTSLKIDMTLSSLDNSNEVIQFSNGYSEINPAAVCLNNQMGNSTLRMDAIVEYSAAGKFVEFYNIQNFVFNDTTASQNITLYNLKESEGQEFKITYKGQDFIPVREIVLQIQRKYIDEGEFKIIEIPMSGTNTYTIAHIVPNDVIYNLIFLKNGSILDTFTEIVADCQNPTIVQCEINLNALITGTDLFNIIEEDDFFSSLTFDRATREVSSTYGIISGASGTTNLNVTLIDNFGNNTACSDSLVAAGGTLSCIVPSSFGDSVVHAQVILNDDPRREGFISLKDSPKDQYEGILIFSSIILLLFIFGIGVSDNPGLTGIFFIIGALLLVGLNIFYSTSWVGAGATILWFIVAVIIVIVKGGSKR